MRTIGNAGSSARRVEAIASGTMSTGDTVVVNADGTVSAVVETSATQTLGSPVVFESASSGPIAATYDTANQKVVIAYRDQGNSNYGTAIVGTVSGTSISFGSPTVFQSANSDSISITYDANAQKVVIAYINRDNNFVGTSVVGTVSGTSISFGSPVIYENALTGNVSITYEASAQKVVIAYKDGNNSDYGTAIVGTVSGTSISFGTAVVFESANSDFIAITYDANAQKVVIVYRDNGEFGTPGKGIVGTVSGTSISFGSAVTFESGNPSNISITYDSSAQKVVIAYRHTDNSSYGTAKVGTVSGTSISYGFAAVFEAANTEVVSATYDSVAQKVVIAYRDRGNSLYGTLNVGTVSGTSISFAGAVVFEAASTGNISTTYDSSNQKVVIAYRDDGNTGYGTAVVFQNSYTSINLTSENFIGFADYGVADGQAVVVNSRGAVQGLELTYYDLANGSYDNVNVDVRTTTGTSEGLVTDVAFSTDGTKMFVSGPDTDTIYQYSLSTGFDLSTASYDSVSLSVAAQDLAPYGITFNTDGTKMFMLGVVNTSVFQYSLSTAFDLSTASYDSVSFNVGSQDTSPYGVRFNTDGTKMFVNGGANDSVYQYSLSTAFDLSTASYDSVSFSVTSQADFPYGMAFNADGTKMFICATLTDTVYQYSLSTAFDLSTASYDNVSLSIASVDSTLLGITFDNTGSKMYVTGGQNDSVYQYSVVNDLTPGQAYYVQVDGTLGTTAADPSVFAGTAVASDKLIVKG